MLVTGAGVAVLLPVEAALADDFFHGWNPLPTAASDKGGGILDDTFAVLAANMVNSVPLSQSWMLLFKHSKSHQSAVAANSSLNIFFFLFPFPPLSFKQRNDILHHPAVLKWGL